MAQFEFVAALCHWVKVSGTNQYKYEDFLDWLFDPFDTRYLSADRKITSTPKNHPTYPYLVDFLKSNGYKPSNQA